MVAGRRKFSGEASKMSFLYLEIPVHGSVLLEFLRFSGTPVLDFLREKIFGHRFRFALALINLESEKAYSLSETVVQLQSVIYN